MAAKSALSPIVVAGPEEWLLGGGHMRPVEEVGLSTKTVQLQLDKVLERL